MPLSLYTSHTGLQHDTGPGHPESPARLQTLLELFKEPAFSGLPLIEIRQAEAEEIYLAHDINYIMTLEERQPVSGYEYFDSDTLMCPESWEAALHAAGAVCQAVDDLFAEHHEGQSRRAFCAVRPPGHHAETDKAMGFCFLNNIFIGARLAQNAYQRQKIAIVDFDVHHGNGTDEMTRRADDILYISSHQWPCYPGTGDPADNIDNKILNCALPPGSGSSDFRALYEQTILPALDDFAPDLLMISAGFDAHRDDPLAQLALDSDDYYWVTKELAAISDRHCQGRLISVLEGGYNLKGLKDSVRAHLQALL